MPYKVARILQKVLLADIGLQKQNLAQPKKKTPKGIEKKVEDRTILYIFPTLKFNLDW